jgi:hypothetical protein
MGFSFAGGYDARVAAVGVNPGADSRSGIREKRARDGGTDAGEITVESGVEGKTKAQCEERVNVGERR